MVMAWSVDRLGRSLQDLVGFLSELHALKIDLFLHQQGLDRKYVGSDELELLVLFPVGTAWEVRYNIDVR